MTRLLLSAGAASAQDRNVPIENFDRIEAGGQYDLFITYGDEVSLRLEGDASKFDDIEIEVRRGKLELSQERRNWFRSSRPIDVQVHLTVVRLEEAEFSTGVDAVIEGMDEAVVDLEVNTGAVAHFSGTCGTAEISVSTGGELRAQDLQCANVDVSASTGGYADVYASERSNARASTGAGVRVYGEPARWEERESLGGEVRYVRGSRIASGG